MQDLFTIVSDILRGPCGVTKEIAPESRLLEDLALDSMGMLALAVSLENHFKIKLEEDPEHPPQTVGEVVTLLSTRLEEKR